MVRGPDWNSGEKDGGEGNPGTVVGVGVGSDPTFQVKWEATGETTDCYCSEKSCRYLVLEASPGEVALSLSLSFCPSLSHTHSLCLSLFLSQCL